MLAFYVSFGLTVLKAQTGLGNGPAENNKSTINAVTSYLSGESKTTILRKYDKLPLAFERVGDAEFLARGQGYRVKIGGPWATLTLAGAGSIEMQFVNARRPTATPEKELPGKVNYIIGNDPARW